MGSPLYENHLLRFSDVCPSRSCALLYRAPVLDVMIHCLSCVCVFVCGRDEAGLLLGDGITPIESALGLPHAHTLALQVRSNLLGERAYKRGG